jgi:hypothetical protein
MNDQGDRKLSGLLIGVAKAERTASETRSHLPNESSLSGTQRNIEDAAPVQF